MSYLADYAADRITKQPDARFDWKELGLDMLAGGLSGGILAGGGAAIGGINNMVNTAPTDTYQNNAIVNTDKIAYNVNKGGDINEKVQNSGRPGWRKIYPGRNVAYSTGAIGENGGNGIESRINTETGGEIPLEDSRGNRIDRSIAEKITGTAITENSKPVKVFHYTQNMDFDTFGEGDTGFHFGTAEQAKQRKTDLKAEGGRTIEVYLNIKNPVHLGNDIMNTKADALALKLYSMDILTQTEWQNIYNTAIRTKDSSYNSEASKQLREILRRKGIDGFSYDNLYEGKGKSYIALYPEQVVIVNDGRQTNKNTAGRFIKESDTIPETPAKANTAPGSYYAQPATPAKTKQDTVYAAYAAELDRQIHQEMAKQSANSRNNKISAASPHNIEKTSENNYNVNKEGVEDVLTDDRRKTAKFNEEIPSVQQNRTADNTEPRRAQGDESGTTAKVSGRTRVKRKDVVFEYTALQENEISDNTKTAIKHLKKFGIEAVAFKGQTVADTSEGIDTLEENESGALGVGFIPVGNELELHGIEAAGHEVEHEFFRQNIPEAVEFHNLVLSKMKEDSRYTKAFERQLKRLGYAEESFPNEKPAFISGWIYSTQYGNNVEFSKELLDYYSKAFDDFEDIVVAHKNL